MADPLKAGYDALARGAWEEARACFEGALDREDPPEGLEGLGTAEWWVNDAVTTLSAAFSHDLV